MKHFNINMQVQQHKLLVQLLSRDKYSAVNTAMNTIPFNLRSEIENILVNGETIEQPIEE